MAAALKKAKEWEQPKVELEKSDEEALSIIKSKEAFAQFQPSKNIFSRITEVTWGQHHKFNLDPPRNLT